LYGLSRLAYHLKGVRFDDSTLLYYWQFLDPPLLRHRLAESLFYLHSQPPLYNLFLGTVLKLSPGMVTSTFHVVYLLLGIALYGTVFALMRRLGVSTGIALAVSTWFMISPSFVLYEHLLFYTMPVAALLAVSALLCYQVLEKQKLPPALLFFVVVLMLCSVRATYHLVYYLLLMGALLVLCVRTRKIIALAALVPLVLLSSLYVKNLAVFDMFATSSWMGMNLASNTVERMSMEERRRLIDRGKLSPLTLMPRFSAVDAYPEEYRRVEGFYGIPALREAKKSTGANNYNHLAYVSISKQCLKDDVYIILHRPRLLLKGMACSWICYFQSSSNYPHLTANRDRIALMERIYDHIFYGVIPWRAWLPLQSKLVPAHFPWRNPMPRPFPFLVIGLPLLVVFALRLAANPQRSGVTLSRNQRVLIALLCFNIIYAAFIGNLLEGGENHRIRFESDALYVVLLGLLLHYSILPRLRAASSRLLRRSPRSKR
jgi:hypothetical protein